MSTIPHPADRAAHQRGPFQFSLRTMLLAVALSAGMFAVIGAVGPLWSVMLCWFGLLAAAHVTANAYGSRRFRDGRAAIPDDRHALPVVAVPCQKPICAPTTCLCQQRALIRPIRIGAVGALAGGFSVGGLLMLAYLGRVGLAGVAVGALSAAVLCGLFGYLATSLVEVTLGAFGEARRGAADAR